LGKEYLAMRRIYMKPKSAPPHHTWG
jgi:hypothetical protein